jgi:kynurenine formamidase
MVRFNRCLSTLACAVAMTFAVVCVRLEGRARDADLLGPERRPAVSHASSQSSAEQSESNAPAPLRVPRPQPDGWGADDERGNGNTQGPATWTRCAAFLTHPRARLYELGRVISRSMPQNPFGDAPVDLTSLPTRGIPFTKHAGNGEIFSGGIGSQGTQFDALGHFGALATAWSGTEPFPADQVTYYNGYTQEQVKPTPDAPLMKLGVDKAVPIVTSAVMLDAAAYRGRRLGPGELVTVDDIEGMLAAQGLQHRGILPGDAVLVHTGWGELWSDPSANPSFTRYYSQGPGLSLDAQAYLAERTVVLVALDNPFTDPAPSPPDAPPDLPFAVHHNNLIRHGIHQIQNLVLDDLARDRVSLSCVIVLPLRILGGAGSMVRPITVGPPRF